MTLEETIRGRIKVAMREKREVEKSILRLALSEIQAQEARAGSLSDEDAAKLVRKLIASNSETMAASPGADHTRLEQENAILESLLPRLWDLQQTKAALAADAGALAAVKAAPNDGAATGAAMKALKSKQAPVDGKVVAQAVKELRP
ncbi:MAG: GatB/YqeY domain-containing protein [Planctomycetes bacterium]|nr:GatB/YqeY domain-containing protein [Planctomycetota bacterium]